MRTQSTLRVVKPASSYEVALPFDVREEHEGRVSSFWLDGSPLAIQLSSYIRQEGDQISATERLNRRIQKESHVWRRLERGLHSDRTVDQASAEFTDENDCTWIHSYLVWPHLAIYAIISGPRLQVADENNWALQALKSVHLVLH